METRLLGAEEAGAVLPLVKDKIEDTLYQRIVEDYRQQILVIFGIFDEQRVCGISALKKDGQVLLVYVMENCRRRGVGSMLLWSMYRYCAAVFQVPVISVLSPSEMTVFFRKLGMQPEGMNMSESGQEGREGDAKIRLVMQVQPETPASPLNSKTPVIIAVVVGVIAVCLVIFGVAAATKRIFLDLQESALERLPYGLEEEGGFYGEGEDPGLEGFPDAGGDYESAEDSTTGMAAVPSYIDEDLSYEITDQSYDYTDNEKETTVITFQVGYPEVTGLSSKKVEKKVNDAIRSCAMETVDKIYINPSEEIKERVLSSQTPMLANLVESKVTYATDGLICVMFSDASYQGGPEYFDETMRACTINLKSGEVYELSDIMELSDSFVEAWITGMQKETGKNAFLTELSPKELQKLLSGKEESGIYDVEFFLDRDGIEIGLNFNYPPEDSHDLGYSWVTAPFSYKEIKQYISDQEFWNLLG